jgi:hypothetical protein
MAVSKDRNGVFRDIRGRTIPSPSDRMGMAMDSLQPAKPVGRDTSAEDMLIRRLLPKLKKMADSSANAEATDDMESENRDLFGAEAADETTNRYAEGMSAYAESRRYWQGVNANNLRNRGRAHAPVNAVASKGH